MSIKLSLLFSRVSSSIRIFWTAFQVSFDAFYFVDLRSNHRQQYFGIILYRVKVNRFVVVFISRVGYDFKLMYIVCFPFYLYLLLIACLLDLSFILEICCLSVLKNIKTFLLFLN